MPDRDMVFPRKTRAECPEMNLYHYPNQTQNGKLFFI